MEVSVDLHLARAIFLKMDKSGELVDVQHSCASGELWLPSCVWLICYLVDRLFIYRLNALAGGITITCFHAITD